PAFEQRGVEAAEVGVEFEVAFAVEVGQAGLRADHPRLHPPARQKYGGGRSVDGSLAGVLANAAAKLREAKDQHAIELAAATKVVDEGRYSRRELGQKSRMAAKLVGMRVKTVVREVVDAGLEAGVDELSDLPQLLGQ